MESLDRVTAFVTAFVTSQLAESAAAAKIQIGNLTQAAGLEASPEAVVWGSVVAICALLCFVCMIVRAVSVLRARERARKNHLAVRMAESAPEDDCDEHEVAVRDDLRTAAQGDSDFEDMCEASKKP